MALSRNQRKAVAAAAAATAAAVEGTIATAAAAAEATAAAEAAAVEAAAATSAATTKVDELSQLRKENEMLKKLVASSATPTTAGDPEVDSTPTSEVDQEVAPEDLCNHRDCPNFLENGFCVKPWIRNRRGWKTCAEAIAAFKEVVPAAFPAAVLPAAIPLLPALVSGTCAYEDCGKHAVHTVTCESKPPKTFPRTFIMENGHEKWAAHFCQNCSAFWENSSKKFSVEENQLIPLQE